MAVVVRIELTEEERAILREAVESTVSDLGTEISNTERIAMRTALKRRREVFGKLLEALDAS